MYLLASDSFNENEHCLNNYEYHKSNQSQEMTLLAHLHVLQYWLHCQK